MLYPRISVTRINEAITKQRTAWLSDSGGWRGFGQLLLRISANGKGRFYFRYTQGGERRTVVIGRYSRNAAPGFLTLGEARSAAARLSSLLTAGESPTGVRTMEHAARSRVEARNALNTPAGLESALHEVRRSETICEPALGGSREQELDASDSKLSQATQKPLTVAQVCDAYVEWLRRNGKQSWKSVQNTLRRHVVDSNLGNRLAREITSEEVAELLRQMADRGIQRTVNQVRSVLRTAFTRAMTGKLDPSASTESIDRRSARTPSHRSYGSRDLIGLGGGN